MHTIDRTNKETSLAFDLASFYFVPCLMVGNKHQTDRTEENSETGRQAGRQAQNQSDRRNERQKNRQRKKRRTSWPLSDVGCDLPVVRRGGRWADHADFGWATPRSGRPRAATFAVSQSDIALSVPAGPMDSKSACGRMSCISGGVMQVAD